MAIDTHGYVKALTAAGVPAAQAEAHVEALRDKVLPELATKQDLRELGSGLRKEMTELKSELRTEMGELRSDLRAEMVELKSELRGEMAGIRTDMWKMSFAVVLATAMLVTFLQKLLAEGLIDGRGVSQCAARSLASMASQIKAAMSAPPKALTWRMPVGDVTLISVK
jgi:hypothetical protein